MFMKTIREKIEDIVNKPVEMGGVYYMKDIIDDLEALFKKEMWNKLRDCVDGKSKCSSCANGCYEDSPKDCEKRISKLKGN